MIIAVIAVISEAQRIQRSKLSQYISISVCSITSRLNKANLPTHIELNAGNYDMVKDSVILLEQLRTIDKKRLKDKVCHLDTITMEKVNRALEISLELT